jgi:hypothetical protein
MTGTNLRFLPNRLERLRPGAAWECAAEGVTGVRSRGKLWLVVETTEGVETFRIFGARAAGPILEEAIRAAVTTAGSGAHRRRQPDPTHPGISPAERL